MNHTSYFKDIIDQHKKCKSLPVDFNKIEFAVQQDNMGALVLSRRIFQDAGNLKQLIESEFDILNANNTRTIINGLTDIVENARRQNAFLEAQNSF
jgi:hypothetical protein